MQKILKRRAEQGFTLLETMIAMAILSFGILTLVSFFSQGVQASYRTQIQFIAQQKAQEAVESIFTARDTQMLSFAQINNVSAGGVFLDGPQPLLAPGPDGLVGTADDDATNPDAVVVAPGPDKVLGTSDDITINLNPWMTRTILIQPVPNEPNLNQITVTVNYNYEGQPGQFQLVCYISSYS